MSTVNSHEIDLSRANVHFELHVTKSRFLFCVYVGVGSFQNVIHSKILEELYELN